MNAKKLDRSDKQFPQQQWDTLVDDDCRQLVRLAVREDLDRGYDWTTVALVPESSTGVADIVARQGGIAAGFEAIPTIVDEMECQLTWTSQCRDGDCFQAGAILGTLKGAARDLLTAERLILNLVSHLCGVATLTSQFVQAIRDTPTEIYDTRKTHPGYRRLEKYAVRCGGGFNHRSGLYDAVLIKDNHLAFSRRHKHHSVADAVDSVRNFLRQTLPENQSMIIEVEVDNLQQLETVLPSQPDLVLLDNLSPDELSHAVALRNEHASTTLLEASGGVSLDSVTAIARSGVERISVGALTHSARCLDLGLDWHVD